MLVTLRSNRYSTPFFSSIVQTLKLEYNSVFIGYMNGDLLLHSSLIESLSFLFDTVVSGKPKTPLMLMGRRYNRNMAMKDDLTNRSTEAISAFIEENTLFSDQFITVAQDFFIFTPSTLRLQDLLDVVIGRNGYDNYLVDFCIKHHIPLVDLSPSGFTLAPSSYAAIVLHQTDHDGNWAGSRQSKDREWNLDLIEGLVETDTLSRAPYQLVHHRDGRFVLHEYAMFDNDYSDEEWNFIQRFVPPKAERLPFSLE